MSDIVATTSQTQRRGLFLSGLTALGALWVLVSYTPLDFVSVNLVQAIILVALGIVGDVGSLRGARPLIVGVGGVLIVVGLIRLVTYGQTIGIISGGVGAGAYMVGLGTAFIAVWIAGRPAKL